MQATELRLAELEDGYNAPAAELHAVCPHLYNSHFRHTTGPQNSRACCCAGRHRQYAGVYLTTACACITHALIFAGQTATSSMCNLKYAHPNMFAAASLCASLALRYVFVWLKWLTASISKRRGACGPCGQSTVASKCARGMLGRSIQSQTTRAAGHCCCTLSLKGSTYSLYVGQWSCIAGQARGSVEPLTTALTRLQSLSTLKHCACTCAHEHCST